MDRCICISFKCIVLIAPRDMHNKFTDSLVHKTPKVTRYANKRFSPSSLLHTVRNVLVPSTIPLSVLLSICQVYPSSVRKHNPHLEVAPYALSLLPLAVERTSDKLELPASEAVLLEDLVKEPSEGSGLPCAPCVIHACFLLSPAPS